MNRLRACSILAEVQCMDDYEMDIAVASIYDAVKATLAACPNASLQTCIDTSVYAAIPDRYEGTREERYLFGKLRKEAEKAYKMYASKTQM